MGPYLKVKWTGNKFKLLVDLQDIFITENIPSADSTCCLCCPALSDKSHSYWMMERVCFKQFLGPIVNRK